MPIDKVSRGTPADAPTPPEEVMPSALQRSGDRSRAPADAGVTHSAANTSAANTSDSGEASSGAPTLEQRIDGMIIRLSTTGSSDVYAAVELLKEARAALLALRQSLENEQREANADGVRWRGQLKVERDAVEWVRAELRGERAKVEKVEAEVARLCTALDEREKPNQQ